MASDNEASCESDPNFAVICAFMEKFGGTCGLAAVDFLELQEMLENTQEVPQELIDLHIKLLRKSRKTVSNERWEKAVIKFCHTFCVQDAWEIERFGYKKARLSSKLRVLKELLEMQFDYNARFKQEINKMSAEELRSQPFGKDNQGHAYWFQNDSNCQIRVYKEDPDEETWTLVAKDREGLVALISELSNGDSSVNPEAVINEEDSNSLMEKPIIDTGQVDSSSSSENSSESKKAVDISPSDENARMNAQSDDEAEEEEEESAKRPRETDDEEEATSKKRKLEEEEEEVGEAIEEPLMLVKGAGDGEENKCVNPIVSEEIVEETMYFYGEGGGFDCETGNEDEPKKTDEKSENCVSIKNAQGGEVPSAPPVKPTYRLGTIIDTKTDNKFFTPSNRGSPAKKSRWDVETIMAKEPVESTGRVKDMVDKWEQMGEETAQPQKKTMFFFGPGCLQFKPNLAASFGQKVPQVGEEAVPDDVGYRICGAGTPIESSSLECKLVEETKADGVSSVEAAVSDEGLCDVETDVIRKIPEVTAALLECDRNLDDNKRCTDTETKETDLPDDSRDDESDKSEPKPVIEEECVKKHSYLLGEKEEDETVPEIVSSLEKIEDVESKPDATENQAELMQSAPEVTEEKSKRSEELESNLEVPEEKSDRTEEVESKSQVTAAETEVTEEKSERPEEIESKQEVTASEKEVTEEKSEDQSSEIIETETESKSEDAPVTASETERAEAEIEEKSENATVVTAAEAESVEVEVTEQQSEATETESDQKLEDASVIATAEAAEEKLEEVLETEEAESDQKSEDATEVKLLEEDSTEVKLSEEDSENTVEPANREIDQKSEGSELLEQKSETTTTVETTDTETDKKSEDAIVPSEEIEHLEQTSEAAAVVTADDKVDVVENDVQQKSEDVAVTVKEEIQTKLVEVDAVENDVQQKSEDAAVTEKEETQTKLDIAEENSELTTFTLKETEGSENVLGQNLEEQSPAAVVDEAVADIETIDEIPEEKAVDHASETGATEDKVVTEIEVSEQKSEFEKFNEERPETILEVLEDKSEGTAVADVEVEEGIRTEVPEIVAAKEKDETNTKVEDLEQKSEFVAVAAKEKEEVIEDTKEKLEDSAVEIKEKDELVTEAEVSQQKPETRETEVKVLKEKSEDLLTAKEEVVTKVETLEEKPENTTEAIEEKNDVKAEISDKKSEEKSEVENVVGSIEADSKIVSKLEVVEVTKKIPEVCEEPLSNKVELKTPQEEEDIKTSAVIEEVKDNQRNKKDSNCLVSEEENKVEETVSVPEIKEQPSPIVEEPKPKQSEEPIRNNKSVRGRKNNISEQPTRISTRRSTRSSKNEERAETVTKTIDERRISTTDLSSGGVKEEKKDPPPSSKEEKVKTEEVQTTVQPRRGRSRGIPKVEKEEIQEGNDSSKKMKMSNEEETEAKPSRLTRNKAKEVKAEEERIEEVLVEEEKVEVVPEVVSIESSNSNEAPEVTERDPLAVSEEEQVKEEKPMSLATFSLDFNDSPSPTPAPPLTRRGLRKRGRESPVNAEETEETAGKRLKKGKRNIDAKLRKSIEEQKKQELISSDDDKQQQQQEEVKTPKKKGNKHKKLEQLKSEETIVVSSDPETEIPKEKEVKEKKPKPYAKNKRILSNLGIDPDRPMEFNDEATIGVRQSRRIAQLKIKEEAERRKLEEEMALDHKKKKKKSKKSEDKDFKVKRSKVDADDEDEAQEEDSADSKKRKKKKKKKKHRKLFDEFNPWRSSSDSSTTDDEEEEEIGEEEDDEELQYVSDHEFSPESDLEADGEALPLKRARTARKESDVEEVDDCPCQKCGKSDHPEWILLCDSCDNGWHCSCLRPPLLVIPEGDWFCPPCQHTSLLKKLQEKLKDFDKTLKKKEIEDRRKQRLAYVGISLNSVLPTKETENIKKRRLSKKDDDDEDDEDEEDESEDSGSGSTSGSESGSESDEPIYQLRQRRQAHSYRFNDYDELINSAIQDEMEAVKGAGNQGRGKDIATIVNAEKEEERKKEAENGAPDEVPEPEPLPPVVPVNDKDKEAKPLYSDDDEPIKGVKKKIVGRKKHRKLNALDISSDDDDENADEDFKGTSSDSDDDFDEESGTEDSDELDSGRGKRRNMDPVRRSTRARTSRYDADFIDDGDSEDEDEAPRRKKKRSIWDDSESEESDRSWGRRKRKPASRKKNTTTSTTKKKKSKKKKKGNDDSDAEVYRKKKPKIKFGLDGDDDGPVRRTRGKKINYIDALGSDSDEDRVKRPPPRIESEEEYVANEDEELDEDDKVTDEEESGEESKNLPKQQKVQIQSYADARFTQLLPEGVPTPKDLYSNNQEDGEDEPNPIDQINRNVEMMDENEMEKMMEEEEYANKQLQLVALQLEKEKRRKEREAKKLGSVIPQSVVPPQQEVKKRGRKPLEKDQFQFTGGIQEPLVGNVEGLIVNSENNDELSEPPGVSLPLFAELGTGGENLEDPVKKRRPPGRPKKSLEEAVANLGSVRQQESFIQLNKSLPTDLSVQDSNIEIAAPPQPFSQSQPTPSVITRMLQSKPGQPGYPVGTIRPKQFAAMTEREEEVATSGGHHTLTPAPAHHGQYIQGGALRPQQMTPPYRQMAPSMNHYPRPRPHMYPSPSGGGITMGGGSPSRIPPAAGSPGGGKQAGTPPPYSRPPPPRHLAPVHLQPPRTLSPYHQGLYPGGHYGGQFGQPPPEELPPPPVYQSSPYPGAEFEGGQANENSKGYEEEAGGEFGGLVSYFSSQREDDLES